MFLAATLSNATAAPPAKTAEDRYIVARDAAIEKISAIYDAGNSDDAARRAEEAAAADLGAQMRLRAHKDWWGKNIKNVPQQIGAAGREAAFRGPHQ